MPLHHEAWRRWFAERGLPSTKAASSRPPPAAPTPRSWPTCFRSAARRARRAGPAQGDDLPRARRVLAAADRRLHGLSPCRARSRSGAGHLHRRAAGQHGAGVSPLRPRQAWSTSITSPADGLRGKPHPDIFVEAARRLGVAPPQCTVFEDAPLGIEAARRAGMRAVALTTSLPATAFAQFPNLVATAPDFTTLRVASLTQHNQVIHHA